jgi:predicted nucleic acid-binding protein
VRHVVLDAGALIALDRGLATVRGYVLLADRAKVVLSTSSAVVAQVWRGGARQARLARLLSSDLLTEIPLDPDAARRIGVLAATTGSRDVVDGHVAIISLDREAVVLTSDPEDIARWGVPNANLVRC